jgi:osmotically-inducible protein OsmY
MADRFDRASAPRRATWLIVALLIAAAVPARAQSGDAVPVPKALVERATDARSAADIKRDNAIILAVNKAMADAGTIKASAEAYEQRLVVTGLFDDKDAYDRFEKAVRAIRGVKRLYWQVADLPNPEQAARRTAGTMIDWADVLAMETRAEGRLIGATGISDVNFRVAGDVFGTLYVLGRARSKDEADKAIASAKKGAGVRKVVSYIDVRP